MLFVSNNSSCVPKAFISPLSITIILSASWTEDILWAIISFVVLGISSEKAMLLEHMVISHHGEPDFGAAVRPMFLEAEILSQLDTLDATVYEITSAVGEVKEGEFTGRMWALDNRKLFNHGRKESIAKANLE